MQTRSPNTAGRDRELHLLDEALHGARSGRGTAVFLVGEPGIGKTRLIGAVTGMAFDTGMRVLSGRCSTIGPMIPFRPLTEAVMSLVRDHSLAGVDELGAYRPILARLAPELGPGDDSSESSLVLLAEAVLRLLSLAGRGQGCLLALDDLQDADTETLAVVEYLIDNITTQPVTLALTTRAEPCDALDLARSASHRGNCVLLELHRLDRTEVTAMAAACLDASPEHIPAEVLDQLWADSAGNPFVVEELLHSLIDSGLLVSATDGWQLVGPLRKRVPAALVRSIAHRTDRLDPHAREMLWVAAVLGHRFPLSVVRQATGSDDRSVVANLHACVTAQLVVPDEPAPDWYAFRHPLTAEAILTGLTPLERVALSRRAADAIQYLHPDLAGDWCPLLASLWLAAGSTVNAGQLFAEAGRRALERGAPDSAVSLLEQAMQLLAGHDDVNSRADCLEWLLRAFSETGRFEFERALQLAKVADQLSDHGLSRRRRVALHVGLAKVANAAGRWSDGMAQVAAARALLGEDADDADSAPVDAVAASLAWKQPSADRLQVATALASRAAATAERTGLHAVACEAWQLLGTIHKHDLAEADRYFARSLQLAERHRLPLKRITALYWLAGSVCLTNGSVTRLVEVRQEALRTGAITIVYSIDGILGLQAALRAEHVEATQLLDECWPAVARLRIIRLIRYSLMAKVVLAAHQGRRNAMEEALGDFHQWDGTGSPEQVLTMGLGRTFCALLEEDRELAEHELAQTLAHEAEQPSSYYLTGQYGLNLLLGVLAGRMGWPDYHRTTASSISRMRWNSQFVHLAHAVILGRDGSHSEADSAMTTAQGAAACYPMAQHLGLRLVAPEALDAGWGQPVEWLRRAENYFHNAGMPAVTRACRSIMRQGGVSVPQRRSGTDRLPAALRDRGVTVREYEVFRLIADRMGNKAIATQLYISPRTVEKHVASLMIKTGLTEREALVTYARQLLTG